MILKFISLILILAIMSFEFVSANNDELSMQTDCVILLHGLGRDRDSMSKIAQALESSGYIVWNESYPSREKTIGELTEIAIEPAMEFCRSVNSSTINFVTHSLGGILVRYYLQTHKIEELRRIVMLSPPNKGSEIADQLKANKIFQYITGPTGQQLGTNKQSVPNLLKPVSGEIGIITGRTTSDPWFSWLIQGEDDGKVSVVSAQLDEMKDFLVVDHGHTFIMRQGDVIEQIKSFLMTGAFVHTSFLPRADKPKN